jgi:hypothetical protein
MVSGVRWLLLAAALAMVVRGAASAAVEVCKDAKYKVRAGPEEAD